MKILHFSDTHLGFSDLEILNDKNINQREADFYDAFKQVVKQIKKIKPDYIIHTGDLFHRVSPTNRAISFALSQFKEINKLKIPFIIIAGNHSTPRTTLSTPILKIFENFKNIYISYQQEYKKFEFNNIIFHTIPHINDEQKIENELNLIENNINKNKKNILMLHCSVGASYLMEEFGEWVYPKNKEYIFELMDYVGLGHWHGFKKVKNNVFYSGSTERTSLNDKRNSKGFIIINLDKSLNVEYKEIKIRPVIVKTINSEYFEDDLNNLKTDDIKGVILEIILNNLTPLKSLEISNKDIKSKFENALSVTIKREFKEVETQIYEDVEAIGLEDYFVEHLKEELNLDEFERLKLKAQQLFDKYEEVQNDTY